MGRLHIAVECMVLFVIYETLSKIYTCGPDNQCECSTDNHGFVMDCDGKIVSRLSDICSAIRNTSIKSTAILKAGRNNFRNVNATELVGCESLYTLELNFNQISEFGKDSFKNFSNLEILDLSRNNIQIFKPEWSAAFLPETLSTLILDGFTVDNSSIPSYPNLSHLRKLQTLKLDGLSDNFDIGKHTNRLKELSLSGLSFYSHCSIPHISNSTFRQLLSIVKLNISSCSLRSISAGAFEQLYHLEVLDLSFNRKLGFRSFENLSYGLQFTNIRSVNISYLHTTFGIGTRLFKQDICYLWNTSVEEIAISGNRIMYFETNTVILLPESLTTIDMSENEITFGPFLLQTSCMTNLRIFLGGLQHLAHHPYRYFADDTEEEPTCNNDRMPSRCPFMHETFLNQLAANKSQCNYLQSAGKKTLRSSDFPKYLQFVDLHEGNFIYNLLIDYDIKPNANFVKVLDLSNNIFNIFIGQFGPFPNIEVFNISRCYIMQLGQNTLNYPSLQILRLDKNYLGDQLADSLRSNVFATLISLKALNLSANGITILHTSTFVSLTNLTHLDLSYNNIGILDIMTSSLISLLKIDLHVNSLHTITSDIRTSLEMNAIRRNSTFGLDLQNNSLDYSCENQDFLNWLNEHKSNMNAFEMYVFRLSDGRIMDVTWFQNDISYLAGNCRSYTLLIVLCCIGISSALVTVVGGVIYRHRWKLRYLLFMSRKRFFGYRRLPDYTLKESYIFDAFISYAEDNFRFILDEVIPKLEAENVSLCVHQRDFQAGKAISENIIEAIQSSRKTIVILSEAYLDSKWCMYEFNMARMENLYSREDQGCLLIVMLEKVPHNKMPLEMLRWIQENSYIEYTNEPEGNTMFWDKMVTAKKFNVFALQD
ncbi:toll-like receptor 4 [Dreissena polymorpha]|uniref:TIR domain-containing protein n=1 Tax=Dreissena polymorpha TaxID=45954 RepID=A0A9D4IJ33_DREPO|nr:toll-like receptor 4 [Dreissena polymorpha]KAH3773598.1 hypothetical protein DPMN_174960 [Dreissena polymorpha]